MNDRCTCPLCAVESEDETARYTHLMVNHRKSEIAKELVNEKEKNQDSPARVILGEK